jgi:hypothetical protein
MRDDDLARSVGRNDRLHSRFGDPFQEVIAVIGLIGDESRALDPRAAASSFWIASRNDDS